MHPARPAAAPGRCGTMTTTTSGMDHHTVCRLGAGRGKVISTCLPRHRHQEWIRFLKLIDGQTPPELDLHVIADNYGAHKHPKVKACSRAIRASTSTSSDQQFLAETWSSASCEELTDKRIRRGAFSSVADLIAAIEAYIALTTSARNRWYGPRPSPRSWQSRPGPYQPRYDKISVSHYTRMHG